MRLALPGLVIAPAGYFILSLARWRLGAAELRPLATMHPDARASHVAHLRERLALPRLVALREADRLIPIDLDDPIAVDAFIDLLVRRDAAILIEVRPGPRLV